MRRARCPPHLRLRLCGDVVRRRTTTVPTFLWHSQPQRALIKENGDVSRGVRDMLDAIQISLALWAMIVCGGIKAVQLVHYLL